MEIEIVRLDIIDNDYDENNPRIMDTFYLINPDKTKFDILQENLNNRFDNEQWQDYINIYKFIEENFQTIDIETIEVEW